MILVYRDFLLVYCTIYSSTITDSLLFHKNPKIICNNFEFKKASFSCCSCNQKDQK